MSHNFLTIEEVAQKIGVTRQTVAKYISAKQLNATKLNKSYRISEEDCQRFLNESATHEPLLLWDTLHSRNGLLSYDNKKPRLDVLDQPARGQLHLVEAAPTSPNHFYFGDNADALRLLRPSLLGQVDLIYIDPPYGTGTNFHTQDDELAYADTLVDYQFLEFLRQRLLLLHPLLSERGSFYLHIDKKIGHYVRVLLDEVFGSRNFINDITRIKCNPKNFGRKAYGNYTDMLLYYAKNRDAQIWNDVAEPLSAEQLRKLFPKQHPTKGAYTTHPLHAPGETRDGETGAPWHGLNPPKGRHWRYGHTQLNYLLDNDLIEWSGTGNPRKRVFANEHEGSKVQDIWEFKDRGKSASAYPTQKNEQLLERIVRMSSLPGSLVLDCFAGSGSTLVAAARLGRRFIGMDCSPEAQRVVREQFAAAQLGCTYWEVR